MKDDFPKIYKNKIEKIKSEVQNEYYFNHEKREKTESKKNKDNLIVDKREILNKINNIFKRPDFIYQAYVNIMLKNEKNIDEKIVGIKDNYLITINGTKINIDDILDIN